MIAFIGIALPYHFMIVDATTPVYAGPVIKPTISMTFRRLAIGALDT